MSFLDVGAKRREALRAISAVGGAIVIELALTLVSMLLVRGLNHEYGAPLPVGERAGGVIVAGPLTFSPSLFVLNIGLTAMLLYVLARWSGLVGVGLATLGAPLYLAAVVVAIATDRRSPAGPYGFPIPMDGGAIDPLILWIDTMFWSVVTASVVVLLGRAARRRKRGWSSPPQPLRRFGHPGLVRVWSVARVLRSGCGAGDHAA